MYSLVEKYRKSQWETQWNLSGKVEWKSCAFKNSGKEWGKTLSFARSFTKIYTRISTEIFASFPLFVAQFYTFSTKFNTTINII